MRGMRPSHLHSEWASDKLNVEELVKDAKPYSGGNEYATPDVFESDEEHQDFLAWYRAHREVDRP